MDFIDELKTKTLKTKLSPIEAVITEYILGNANYVCFMSTSEFAKKLNTSSTSVNRASKRLGYGVFSDLQKELRRYVSSQANNGDKFSLPISERFSTEERENSTDVRLSEYVSMVSDNISSVLHKNNMQSIDGAVDMLLNCRRLYIRGFRGTKDIAERTVFLMQILCDKVVSLVSDDEVAVKYHLIDSSEEDVLLIFSFNRYSKSEFNIIEEAKRRNCKILLITDRAITPFSHLVDELLIVGVENVSFFNSNVAAMFLLEFICAKFAEKQRNKTKSRLQEIDEFLSSTKMN